MPSQTSYYRKTNCAMLKFTIRDLFFVVTASAIAVAWWGDHCKLSREIEPTADRAKQIENDPWQEWCWRLVLKHQKSS